jgi:hypothetical protein
MWKDKLRAASLHLVISALIACCVLALVYLGWYRDGLASIEGVGQVLLLLLGIDVVLGPLMTLLVFKRGKKTLLFDLTVIAFLQAAFLTYGVYSVELGRPAFLVFEENRFETVSYADLPPESKEQLAANTDQSTSRSAFGPVFVAAIPPPDPVLAEKLLSSAMAGGVELSQQPKYYKGAEQSFSTILAKARPIEELKKIKGNDAAAIDSFVSSLGAAKVDTIKYLPLKGKTKNGVVIIDSSNSRLITTSQFNAWQ